MREASAGDRNFGRNEHEGRDPEQAEQAETERAAGTGASTKELMHRIGHASQQAALRYQHATRERDRAIADALDALIAADDPSSSPTSNP